MRELKAIPNPSPDVLREIDKNRSQHARLIIEMVKARGGPDRWLDDENDPTPNQEV